MMNFERANPFLVLGVVNSRSNSWIIMNHRENLLVVSCQPII